ncbi:MAG TPA: sensor domain-containing diguanylate cyclase [Thermoleophilaceae bacterium]
MLAVTRLVRSERDLSSLLDAITRTITSSFGFRTAVISLYRPAWDDFQVTAVHGSDGARDALMGAVRTWENWAPLLDERFHHAGAYLILHGEFDWSVVGSHSYTPDLEPVDDPRAWHAEDALIVPLMHTDGHYLGMISVDEPHDGLRPGDEELEVLAAVAAHAGLAIQSVQERENAARYQAALEQLLRVSARLSETLSLDSILGAVCEGIQSALGFGKVSVDLVDAEAGLVRPRAAAGWDTNDADLASPVERVKALFDPQFEIQGCFLLPNEEALARMGLTRPGYESQLNGRGPHAWHHHWLVVPLRDRDGELRAVIWADEPYDRMLPARQRLQALRMFANQAWTALDSVAHVEELRYLADHDPLTRLGNRRAFMTRLEEEVRRSDRYGTRFTLVVCDLDGFKDVNDRYGHLAGDLALTRMANVLRDTVRGTDGAYRLGGDEFGLILIEAERDDAVDVATRISETLASDTESSLGEIHASFGVAVYPDEHRTPEALFHAADAQMYAAKRAGGGIGEPVGA